MRKIILLIIFFTLISSLVGWTISHYLFPGPATQQLDTLVIEDEQGNTATLGSTGKAYQSTLDDQTLGLGYAELEKILAQGPYADPTGRFRLVPDSRRSRLTIIVSVPFELNLALARDWLRNHNYVHIPDFKIDIVHN